MQPYFYPYAGYFRLFAVVETFVIFDDVQFPRRGRVHRCQVPGPDGAAEWLTLPLARPPRDILIKDLAFCADARQPLDRQLSRLSWLGRAAGPSADRVRAHLSGPLGPPVAFLEQGLRLVADILGLSAQIVRSSSFRLDPSLKGQARVIALAQALDARIYVNPPGGRALYDPEVFSRRGLELRFLTPYRGAFDFFLPALVQREPETLRADIQRAALLVR